MIESWLNRHSRVAAEPFWVWLTFQEFATTRTLIGGAIVMVAVVTDILGEIR